VPAWATLRPLRALLDTSALIADDPALFPDEAAISVASLAELHLGVQVAPTPASVRGAWAWGTLAGLSIERGLHPRRRAMDLLIAATAQVLAVPLISLDEDLLALGDVIEVRGRA